MFEVLVASGPRAIDRREWSAKAASILTHGALVAAAFALSQRGAASDHRPIDVFPVFLPPAPQSHGLAPAGGTTVPSPVQLTVPQIPSTINPGTDLPPVGDPLPGSPSADPGFPGLTIGTPGGQFVLPAVPLDAHVVDEPPELLSHPEPRYPEILRQAGLEGRAVIETVIDSTGRPEIASLRIVSATHELFGAEAKQVVLASRFRPGRMAGRAVRVRVQVPVTFSIGR